MKREEFIEEKIAYFKDTRQRMFRPGFDGDNAWMELIIRTVVNETCDVDWIGRKATGEE